MADLSKLRFNGTDYNVKDASAPTRKFTNAYSKTGNLPISSDDTTQTAIGKLENNIIPKSAKGTANGVAELDANGKVPSSQLPSYVDDVLEYSAKSSFPATGESGKIYVDTTTNKTYRWSGSAYVEISESLALGETDSTAYRGDRGKTAYNHSQATSGNPHNVTKSDVGLGNVGNFKAVSTVASQGLSNTEKSNARANIGAGTGNGTYSKPSGGIPKSDLATAVQTSLDQVNTNKTNILYAINTGVKNQFPTNGMTPGSTMTDHGVTLTYNEDGTFTLNGTATGGAATFVFADIPASQNDGNVFKNCILIGGYSSSIYVAVDEWDATVKNRSYNNTTLVDISIPANVRVAVYIRVNGTAQAQNVIVYPFICDKTVYTSDSTFAKPALPNYDLTRLEAEDRAALVDVVDSGAKNLLDTPTVTVSNITFTQDSNSYITASPNNADTRPWNYANTQYKLNLKAGTYIFAMDIKTASSNNGIGFNLLSSNGTSVIHSELSEILSKTGMITWQFTISTAGTYGVIYKCFDMVARLMLCTKAAFGVSPKFVPYRVPINGVYSHDVPVACSTTLTTTGIKFTATEKAPYRITVTAIYYNSIPLKLVIKYKTNSSANQLPFCTATHADGDDVSLIASGIISLDVGGEFEVFAQYASSTSNYFYVLVEKIG